MRAVAFAALVYVFLSSGALATAVQGSVTLAPGYQYDYSQENGVSGLENNCLRACGWGAATIFAATVPAVT